ncbi:sulfatase [Falsiroseomonas bella]|uniref:Sulfatase n=1 Tax=Falsiroseomonas bella TaxID=2184016 RepID=A0A317FE38_9PROT|nr:sulfatase-like hydrolase/transferase [Falsiroseomonas bella]PWS37145.1 sulfatase [Falsiroseomonas bella]
MRDKRPNILFITTDQQRADCIGAFGRKVRTPHLDLLAAESTAFTACIAPNPVCQPTRASMLTGRMPRSHGVCDNGIDLPPEEARDSFPAVLAKAGYDTALLGKAHFATAHTFHPTGSPECRLSMDRYGPNWTGPYMGFQRVELVVEGHNTFPPMEPPFGQAYEAWYHGDGRGALKDRLYKENHGPDTHGAPQTWHSGLPQAWHNSNWVADRTIAYMNEKRDRPFCLWASFPDPHHPFDCPVPWSLLHRPEDVDLPAHWTLDLDRRPWWHKASLEGVPNLADPKLREFRAKHSRTPVLTETTLREVIANYYGMISLIDHNVGRILTELNRLGLDDNTLVVFTADHGDWLGDHGLLLKGPITYEGLIRVPCLMRGPGVPQGKTCDEPVSTLDMAATFADLAGVEKPERWHSRSLLPVARGEQTRDFAFCEWDLSDSRCGVPLNLRTVRTKRFKLTVEEISGAAEMYDLVADPQEMDNIADDPAHAGTRHELEAMIRARPADARTDRLPAVGMA